MARAYSQDLQDWEIDAALAGLPARRAAVRIGLGMATAIVWVSHARGTGERASSKRSCEKLRSELLRAFGAPIGRILDLFTLPNAPTTSLPPDTIQIKLKTL
jgi:hypothetical protein